MADVADGKERVMEIEKAYKFLDDLETLFLEYPIVADWFMEIRDRKDTADTPQTDCAWK